ncbi:MAG: hypothetical protein K6U74_15595 [Firmicutes bacterium]|nr:hypothetical protein [Bacillota bacterium]
MFYTINFAVRDLIDNEKREKLREKLMGIQGVKDVQISSRDRVSVTYDPGKVIPSQLTAAMKSVGIKTYKG